MEQRRKYLQCLRGFTSIPIQVNGGLYSILLGNTAIQGMASINPNIFQNQSNTKLRVWFNDGINGFQQLSPDRSFASVPYALSADVASIKDGSITRQKTFLLEL